MHEDFTTPATRRQVLSAGAGLLALTLVRPARAAPPDMQAAIKTLAGDAAIRPGKVRIEMSPLVENGNVVPVTVTADSPMTGTDYVKTLALFNEKNPQPNVAVFHLGPRAGRASVSTRMRLATSQKVVALAELSDGTFWSDSVEVIVTLAACVEG